MVGPKKYTKDGKIPRNIFKRYLKMRLGTATKKSWRGLFFTCSCMAALVVDTIETHVHMVLVKCQHLPFYRMQPDSMRITKLIPRQQPRYIVILKKMGSSVV